MEDDLLRVGVITSTHGIKGEVKVFPTTDDPSRYRQLKQVFLDNGGTLLSLEIQGVKFFKKFVIVKFRGIDDINEVEKYKGKDLMILREDAVELEEGEYFISDLIGLKVMTDQGELLGELQDVIQTGANDVYEVRMEDGKEVLLPAIADCILDISLEKGTVLVHLLDGLLD